MAKKRKATKSNSKMLVCLVAVIAAVLAIVAVCVPLNNYHLNVLVGESDTKINGFDYVSAMFYNSDADNASDAWSKMSEGAQVAYSAVLSGDATHTSGVLVGIMTLATLVFAVLDLAIVGLSFVKSKTEKYLPIASILLAVATIVLFICSLTSCSSGSLIVSYAVTATIGAYLALASAVVALAAVALPYLKK